MLDLIKIEVRQLIKTPNKSNEILVGVFRSFMPPSSRTDGRMTERAILIGNPQSYLSSSKLVFVSIKFEKNSGISELLSVFHSQSCPLI